MELVSDEIERISGYPAGNFLASAKRTLLSLVFRDDRDMVLAAIDDARERDAPFSLEYRIVRADGAVRWVLDRGQLVPGAGGRLWMDGAIFDVTERRGGGRALRGGGVGGRRRGLVEGRRALRRHRAPRGGARPARARDRGGPHGRAARLPRPHRRGGRRGAAQDRARPPRRRAAAPRRPRARRPHGAGALRPRPGDGRTVPRQARQGAGGGVGGAARAGPRDPSSRADRARARPGGG